MGGMRYLLKNRDMLVLTALVALVLLPDAVLAQTHAIDDTFCNIVRAFSGGTGKALETVCIIILGIMLMTGKLSLRRSMSEVLGAGLVVGASSVVIALGAGGSAVCP